GVFISADLSPLKIVTGWTDDPQRPEGEEISYSTFEIDGNVDSKLFELPNAPKQAKVPEEKAVELLEQAKKNLKDGNVSLAKVRLRRIVEEFASTQAGPEARKLLEKISKTK